MRSLWDKAEAASRDYVLGKGVRESDVDLVAFRAAAAPLLAAYRRDERLNGLYIGIQELA
jgi:hypothetical protein